MAALPAERLTAVLATLANELASASPTAQRRALLVCGVLGSLAADLVETLLATLNSPRWPVREAALHALARIDSSKPVCDGAAGAALDRSAAVRAAALELLTLRPGEVPDAVASALQHHHPRVRCRALRAVARLNPAGSVAPLTEALTDSHHRVRRTAAETIGGLGVLALPAAGRLARCRCDGNEAVAAAARKALQRLRPHLPAFVEPLLGETNDPQTLLTELLVRLPESLREAAEATRRDRLARLPNRDERAEARWLIGWLVEAARTSVGQA
jgi:HEAT repeat protein